MNPQDPFDEKMVAIADSMGIALYQQFTLQEASLFLRCSKDELKELTQSHKVDFIHVSSRTIGFFGYQLLQYLLGNTTYNTYQNKSPTAPAQQDRIIRAQELETMVGLSRTTLWRRENEGTFPKRISLGGNRVGWKLSEVNAWINKR